jgi:hypothetical protein
MFSIFDFRFSIGPCAVPLCYLLFSIFHFCRVDVGRWTFAFSLQCRRFSIFNIPFSMSEKNQSPAEIAYQKKQL